MTYSLSDRLATLGPRMKAINGKTAIYTRGAFTLTITVTPVLAADPSELMPGVAVTRIEHQDFLVDSADLIIHGQMDTPSIGDTLNWNNHTYRVISPDGESPPYRYTTSQRDRMRIHAERVD